MANSETVSEAISETMTDERFSSVNEPENQHESQPVKPVDIRRSAMDLLARREHSRLELARKLHKKFSHYENDTLTYYNCFLCPERIINF